MNAQHQPVRTRVPHLYQLMLVVAVLALLFTANLFTASTTQAAAVAPVVNMALDAPRAATGAFYTQGNRIIGPDGNVFVPKGVNISGYQWDWNRSTVNDVNSVTACWKFNTIRLNNFLFWGNEWDQYKTNNDIDAIIRTYTARKVVVMVEAHDRTGTYYTSSALTKLTNWYISLANKYKTNPYVWFNVMNEPGDSYLPEKTKWLNVHQTVIKAIRDTAGASNMIVVDGAASGQDAGDVKLATVPSKTSAILSYGSNLLTFNGKTYPNIAFSLHPWDMWNVPDSRMADFFDRVLAKNFPIIVGEYGVEIDEGVRTERATQAIFNTAVPRGIGRIVWHWEDGDPNMLTTAKPWGGGASINDCTIPTNLTWLGKLVWNDTHN